MAEPISVRTFVDDAKGMIAMMENFYFLVG